MAAGRSTEIFEPGGDGERDDREQHAAIGGAVGAERSQGEVGAEADDRREEGEIEQRQEDDRPRAKLKGMPRTTTITRMNSAP